MCVGGACRVTVMAFRAALRVGKADSNAPFDGGGSASGMCQEMHRNCTDVAVSSVQTGTMVRQETAGHQGLFRPTPA